MIARKRRQKKDGKKRLWNWIVVEWMIPLTWHVAKTVMSGWYPCIVVLLDWPNLFLSIVLIETLRIERAFHDYLVAWKARQLWPVMAGKSHLQRRNRHCTTLCWAIISRVLCKFTLYNLIRNHVLTVLFVLFLKNENCFHSTNELSDF